MTTEEPEIKLDETKPSFKNMDDDDDMVIESSDDDSDITVINLASKNLTEIPKSNGNTNIKTLILTKNKIQSLKNLESYPNIETLQLDNNSLKSLDGLPKLLNLKTLWLNNNNLTNLNSLLNILKKQTPKLNYLSLLKNPLCPDIFFGHGNDSQYIRYRHTVIWNISNLKFLDTQEIKNNERVEAAKKGKYLTVAKPDKKQMNDHEDISTNNDDNNIDGTNGNNDDDTIYNNAQPAAFLGKGKIKYDGRESEGNRFILNTDL